MLFFKKNKIKIIFLLKLFKNNLMLFKHLKKF